MLFLKSRTDPSYRFVFLNVSVIEVTLANNASLGQSIRTEGNPSCRGEKGREGTGEEDDVSLV